MANSICTSLRRQKFEKAEDYCLMADQEKVVMSRQIENATRELRVSKNLIIKLLAGTHHNRKNKRTWNKPDAILKSPM